MSRAPSPHGTAPAPTSSSHSVTPSALGTITSNPSSPVYPVRLTTQPVSLYRVGVAK